MSRRAAISTTPPRTAVPASSRDGLAAGGAARSVCMVISFTSSQQVSEASGAAFVDEFATGANALAARCTLKATTRRKSLFMSGHFHERIKDLRRVSAKSNQRTAQKQP